MSSVAVTIDGQDLASTDLTVEDLRAASWAIEEEVAAREVMATAVQAADSLARSYLSARDRGTAEGEPAEWVAPTGALGAYPEGWLVTRGGKTWRSMMVGNPHEPGGADHGQAWVEVLEEPPAGEYLAWGTGQVVKVGDRRTHEGRLWAAKLDHTTHLGWVPSAATHAVWEDLGVHPAPTAGSSITGGVLPKSPARSS